MLTTPKLKTLQELIAGATKEELIWLSGYLAGVVAQTTGQPAITTNVLVTAPEPEAAAKPVVSKITIAYGTETGNSKKLATDFAARAKKKGINAKLVGLEQYRLTDLSKEEYFFTVISTQGDGEPPASARKFYDHIHKESLQLTQLKYSVLALGDTSYPLFCKAGEDVDEQLQRMGGQRIVSLQKCDTDYEVEAGGWFDQILQKLVSSTAPALSAPGVVVRKSTGKKIHAGTVISNINLNDIGSGKQTHHLEIAAEVEYQPGDSIGITPENPREIVEAIISLTGIDPTRKMTYREEELSVADLLRRKLNIVFLPERVVKKYAAIVRQDIPETRIGLLDLLKIYPVKDITQFQEVISILEPTAPRLYSISSSPEAHGGEVHITVAKDTFVVNGETKHGLCSDVLSQLSPDQTLEFYVHKNSQFKLPDHDKDVIMIGPGTGIAPFRSFLAERDATGAGGRNWLFFGDQHFTTDFLYQTEIQNWIQTGVLTKINTAFSRDQQDKVYVQHKMHKQAAELYAWLEAGAYVYLCGAKEPMSVDVENALLTIIQQQGKKNAAQAEGYLDELKEAGRYVKDVY
ncbi:flavodoxin domain-containing protein [Flavitalea sp. BT771]|uniref:diflavin oxidoreductase n=1 Tax=Flavitalea sp. BT771 TaxID=3063329 RepID=UPI0026E1A811|nr:flavodoxin domain-containing protein [Flavitalea sp. BT771]MDO6431346.1 flavodoxin domain-containing protein [Flavitalea sp. BT771]MDV6220254.1 flavodoxin domain-containing protein [Flavitalea sp. BT771]